MEIKKNQVTMSISSTEVESSEYKLMRCVCAELTWLSWLSHLFRELQVDDITPIRLMCDNMAAMYIAVNSVFQEMTKYIIEIDETR